MLREFKAFRFKSGSANNHVTFDEFERGLKHLGIEMPHSTARQFFDHLDTSGDGEIDYAEFVSGILQG
jgi:Ca2+-binding EF-hand superfamily protein